MEQEQVSNDWREEVSDSSKATLKIADGETATFVFKSEGKKVTSVDYGTSIVFEVNHENEDKNWYVSANNYDLQKQIKAFGKLIGLGVEVSRIGSKKSDTRYTIKAITEQEAPKVVEQKQF